MRNRNKEEHNCKFFKNPFVSSIIVSAIVLSRGALNVCQIEWLRCRYKPQETRQGVRQMRNLVCPYPCMFMIAHKFNWLSSKPLDFLIKWSGFLIKCLTKQKESRLEWVLGNVLGIHSPLWHCHNGAHLTMERAVFVVETAASIC